MMKPSGNKRWQKKKDGQWPMEQSTIFNVTDESSWQDEIDELTIRTNIDESYDSRSSGNKAAKKMNKRSDVNSNEDSPMSFPNTVVRGRLKHNFGFMRSDEIMSKLVQKTISKQRWDPVRKRQHREQPIQRQQQPHREQPIQHTTAIQRQQQPHQEQPIQHTTAIQRQQQQPYCEQRYKELPQWSRRRSKTRGGHDVTFPDANIVTINIANESTDLADSDVVVVLKKKTKQRRRKLSKQSSLSSVQEFDSPQTSSSSSLKSRRVSFVQMDEDDESSIPDCDVIVV